MTGIIPDGVNGAKIVRDASRACLAPTGVQNAYCPPNTFATTCEVGALPSDCTARITPAQINAIVSEMLALAVAMDPTGTWNCAMVTNLAAAFLNWSDNIGNADLVTIDGTGTTADPYKVVPEGVATAICGDNPATAILANCLRSSDPGNGILLGADGRLFGGGTQTDLTIDGVGSALDPFRVNVDATVLAICADDSAHDALVACLISTDANNGLVIGTDGGLVAGKSDFYNAQTFGGTPNAMSAAGTPTMSAATLHTGSVLVGIQSATNTGPGVTITVDGVARNVFRADGVTPLAAGDLIVGHEIMYRYDGANWCAVMDMSTGGAIPAASAGAIADFINAGVFSGSSDALTSPASNPIPAVNVRGEFVHGTIASTSTTTNPTMSVGGAPAASIRAKDGTALAVGALIQDHDVGFLFDGTNWRAVYDYTAGSPIPAGSAGTTDFYNAGSFGGTANSLASSSNPVMPALPAVGSVMSGQITNTNTGPVTATIDGNTFPVVAANGTALTGGELIAGHNWEFYFDGANWRASRDMSSKSTSGCVNLIAEGTTTNVATGGVIADIIDLAGWQQVELSISDDSGVSNFVSAGVLLSSDNGATWDITGYTARNNVGGIVGNRITQFYWDGSTATKVNGMTLTGLNTGTGVTAISDSLYLGHSTDLAVRTALRIYNDGALPGTFTYRLYGTKKDF